MKSDPGRNSIKSKGLCDCDWNRFFFVYSFGLDGIKKKKKRDLTWKKRKIIKNEADDAIRRKKKWGNVSGISDLDLLWLFTKFKFSFFPFQSNIES